MIAKFVCGIFFVVSCGVLCHILRKSGVCNLRSGLLQVSFYRSYIHLLNIMLINIPALLLLFSNLNFTSIIKNSYQLLNGKD